MKNLDDLKNDLNKVNKDFIQKCVNDIIDKHLGLIKNEIKKEKGCFETKVNGDKVQVIPKGFSDELISKINSLLPKL
jgi:hypothetical protein